MLHFESKEVYEQAFYAFMQNQQTPSVWYDWIGRLGEFTSMRDAYESLTEADEMEIITNGLGEYASFLALEDEGNGSEQEAVSVIRTPFEARIVNKQGMLQVGDSVYRYFPKHYLSAHKPSEDQFAQMLHATSTSDLAFANTVDIHVDVLESASKVLACGGNTNVKTQYASSPLRRMNATLIYSSSKNLANSYNHIFIAEVKNQRRNGQIWWARTADKISTTLGHDVAPADQSNWNYGPWTPNDHYFEDFNVKNIDPAFAFWPNTDKKIDFDFWGTNYILDKDGSSDTTVVNDRWCN